MLSILDKALQAILKMLKKKDERVLLWKNASPTSTFKGQTLEIQWQSYDMLQFECDFVTTGNVDKISATTHCVENHVLHADYMYLTQTSAPRVAERNFTCSPEGLTVSDGWYGLASGKAAVNSDYLIPLAIYGIKSSGGGKLVSLFRKLLTRGGVRRVY